MSQDGEDNDFNIVQSATTPEDFPDQADIEESEKLADIANKAVLSAAVLSVYHALASATMQHVIESVDQGDSTEPTADNTRYLHYDSAQFESLTIDLPDSVLTMTRTKLEGVERFNTLTKYSLQLEDGLLKKILTLQFNDEAIYIVDLGIRPSIDPLIYRGISLLGNDEFSQLVSTLAGRFTSEEVLDESLGDIWIRFQGTSKEDEIMPFLDEIRQRALAARDSTRINREHGMNRPSVDQLEEFKRLLE